MAYIFNLYFMGWQLCVMEVVVSISRTFNIVSSFACVKFIIRGPDTKMYNYADNVCNQEVFRFLSFIEKQNMKHCVYSWWRKYIILTTVSVLKILHFCNSIFLVWLLPPHFSCSLVQDLRRSQWWGFIMRS